MIARLIKHLTRPGWWLRRHLPKTALERIKAAVSRAEIGHGSEIRVAIETSLGLPMLLRGVTARERAVEVFSRLRVWDTEENNGVLLYALLADRNVEIVADRGIAGRVAEVEWGGICLEMEALFRADRHEEALSTGVRLIGEKLAVLYPRGRKLDNQLPDQPEMLKLD